MSLKTSTVGGGKKDYKKLSESTLEIYDKNKNSLKKSIIEDEKEDDEFDKKKPRKKNETVAINLNNFTLPGEEDVESNTPPKDSKDFKLSQELENDPLVLKNTIKLHLMKIGGLERKFAELERKN